MAMQILSFSGHKNSVNQSINQSINQQCSIVIFSGGKTYLQANRKRMTVIWVSDLKKEDISE